MTEATMQDDYRTIALADLIPSKTNPRRRRDPKADAELAESIRKVGIIEPLVVRHSGDRFEIVVGRRRFEAAKAVVGMNTVPAVVRDLSDDEVLEIQLIENLQRVDVHPLEEANGYDALMHRRGYTAEQVAERIGKSESYVYQRLKLRALAGKARAAFEADRITAGHAILLARLQPKDQERILARITNRGDQVTSVRETMRVIDQEIHLRLAGAPWDLADATLYPKAGACTTCPKRTGAQPALWPEIKTKDTCTDPACFRTKMTLTVDAKVAAFREAEGKDAPLLDGRSKWSLSHWQDGKQIQEKRRPGALGPEEFRRAAKGSCPHVETALVVARGDDLGDAGELPAIGAQVGICRTPKCPVHGRGRAGSSPAERAATKRAKREAGAREAGQQAVLEAVIAKVPETALGPKAAQTMRAIARAAWRWIWHDAQKRHLVRWQQPLPSKGKADYEGVERVGLAYLERVPTLALLPRVVELCLELDVQRGEGLLEELAKPAGVAVGTIERKARATFLAAERKKDAAAATRKRHRKKKAAVQTSASAAQRSPGHRASAGHAGRARARPRASGAKAARPKP